MNKEALVAELRGLERPITDYDRQALLADLRSYPTDIDEGRSEYKGWKKGNVYFHALEDVRFAKTIYGNDTLHTRLGKYLKSSQACFVKDLDLYLATFPGDESQEMRETFELIFRVGTSAYWDKDRELVTDLD